MRVILNEFVVKLSEHICELPRVNSLLALFNLLNFSCFLDLKSLDKLSDFGNHVLIVNVIGTHDAFDKLFRLISAGQNFFTFALLELILIEITFDHTIADG